MLSLQEVTKTYPIGKGASVTAVRDITLDVERGEFVVITGRSGAGKTTLLNLVAGLARPTSGRVLWDGVDLWDLPDREQSRLRNRKIGFIFQFPSLIPSLTALENVVLPTAFGLDRGGPKTYRRARELLRTVGLSDKLAAYPRQLSAGEQQRVVIARSLINQPELLLADEATSDLDVQTEQEIMALFRKIYTTTDLTVLMVTHAIQLAPHASRVIEMVGGGICTEKAVSSSVLKGS
jgi:ABC-type lipoprotein export system ATPase subunit